MPTHATRLRHLRRPGRHRLHEGARRRQSAFAIVRVADGERPRHAIRARPGRGAPGERARLVPVLLGRVASQQNNASADGTAEAAMAIGLARKGGWGRKSDLPLAYDFETANGQAGPHVRPPSAPVRRRLPEGTRPLPDRLHRAELLDVHPPPPHPGQRDRVGRCPCGSRTGRCRGRRRSSRGATRGCSGSTQTTERSRRLDASATPTTSGGARATSRS